jgi:acyl-CoA hydrolase
MTKAKGRPSVTDSPDLTPRPQWASLTEMNEYVLPQHANVLGNVFGGQIMAWVDLCAAICSQRHSGMQTVTAFVDDLKFQQPVRVGEVVCLRARVSATFRTSLELHVTVEGEDSITRRRWPCVDAFLVFVAIGDDGRPRPVPPLALEDDATRASQAAAEARRATRLQSAAQ